MKRAGDNRVVAIVAATFLLGCLLGWLVGYEYVESQTAAKRSVARGVAYNHAQRLSQRLQESLGPAYMLASLVQQQGGKVDNFEAVAVDLLQQFPMARAVELAPGGVVRQVYPLPGNESIVGHDLLKDKKRNREAHLAIARRQFTLAGPFELLQGGLGAVGRYPIFRTLADGRDDFWGFSIVLLRVPELLGSAGFLQITGEGYGYEICRELPDNEGCKVFSREGREPLEDPVTVDVDVPNGKWILSIAPDQGWVTGSDWALVAGIAAAVGALLAALQLALVRRISTLG